MYNDVYSNPESYGLEIVGVAYRDDCYYEFDMFVVWKDATGQLYYAADSGCSCPSPFEHYTSLADLAYGSAQQVHEALDEWVKGIYSSDKESSAAELHVKIAFL